MITTLQKVKTGEDLGEALQQAIEIEMATIPIYLYTYYSIIRVPNQGQIQSDITNRLIDGGLPPAQAAQQALTRSAELMSFATKAGATIMSVVIEEMLHMALSSNVKRALVGMPKLVGLSPEAWPVNLPGRFPALHIDLAPLSSEQLEQFVEIEKPSAPPPQANNISPEWTSIGEFYNSIKEYITENITDKDYEKFAGMPQLGPNRNYYATNNVDTLYYDKYHKPKFANANDSGDLVLVVDNASACKALETIIDQGEGLAIDYECKNIDDDTDDSLHEEESHYCKFVKLKREFDTLTDEEMKYFIKPYPVNPKTAHYPEDIQAVSNMVNAVYTYLFIMMEGCYRNPMPQQSEIFNFGMHKGMVFILSTLCDFITSLPLPDGNFAAPTFENYAFSPESTAKAQLISLYSAIPESLNPPASIPGRLSNLPDMSTIPGEAVIF